MAENSALIIAASDDARASLSSMVLEAGISDISAADGKNIRELIPAKTYSVILPVLPLEDEFGLETVSYINKMSDASLVVFAPSKVYDEVCAKIIRLGITVLPKSAPRNLAVNSIRAAAASKIKLDELRAENETLRNMVNEMKLVNRAKCVLIEYLRISEKEAHRQIQKRAMDQRITLTEVAADILKTYEYR